jgi:hypothetical protein
MREIEFAGDERSMANAHRCRLGGISLLLIAFVGGEAASVSAVFALVLAATVLSKPDSSLRSVWPTVSVRFRIAIVLLVVFTAALAIGLLIEPSWLLTVGGVGVFAWLIVARLVALGACPILLSQESLVSEASV